MGKNSLKISMDIFHFLKLVQIQNKSQATDKEVDLSQ